MHRMTSLQCDDVDVSLATKWHKCGNCESLFITFDIIICRLVTVLSASVSYCCVPSLCMSTLIAESIRKWHNFYFTNICSLLFISLSRTVPASLSFLLSRSTYHSHWKWIEEDLRKKRYEIKMNINTQVFHTTATQVSNKTMSMEYFLFIYL